MFKKLFSLFWVFFIFSAFFIPAYVDAGGGGAEGLVPCGNQDNPSAATDCDFNDFITLVQNVMNFLLFVVAIPIAAISFAWAGWLYMSAGGNETNVKKAHDIFFSVVVGLALALAAWLIIYSLVNGLGVGKNFSQFLGQSGGP